MSITLKIELISTIIIKLAHYDNNIIVIYNSLIYNDLDLIY